MRLLIFGAGGFIGSHLSREAIAQGHDVLGSSRSGSIPGFAGECFRWEFGQSLPASALKNIDCALHLAHDFRGAEGASLTITSIRETVDLLRDAGVSRQIFFSSYSASRRATSIYGRTKFAIEEFLSSASDVVIVRPGLVLGDGGISGRIAKMARLLPVIPLPDGGRGLVPVITIERLCGETLALAREPSPVREANLFETRLRSLRQLVEEAARAAGKHPIILPIPAQWMVAALQVADQMRISLPVNTDNLKGFLANQESPHRSTLNS